MSRTAKSQHERSVGGPRRLWKAGLTASAGLGALLAGQPASAQEATPPPSATSVAEVVVTANKREERLVDVAASVSAVQAEDLQRRQLVNLEDISTQVSGFQVQRVSPTRQRLILRGQNSGGQGATVATVIDDVPFTSSSSVLESAVLSADIDPFDLDRIEVLRGPQGTLYGASAQGGLVKYVTNAPNLRDVSAGVEASAFTVEEGESSGAVKGFFNTPLIQDTLALRASAYYQGIAGYVDNPLLGSEDANGGYKAGGRASLLWRPNEDLSVRLTGFTQYTKVDGGSQVEVGGATFSPTNPPSNRFDPIGDYQNNVYHPNKSENRLNYAAANVSYDLDFATLNSITSYGVFKLVGVTDGSNGAAAPGGVLPGYPLGVTNGVLFGLFYFGGSPASSRIDQTNRMRKFNQELRLSSNEGSTLFGRRFDWQVGLFYTRELGDYEQYFHAYAPFTESPELLTAPPLPPVQAGGVSVPNTYREWAGFADGTFYFTPEFSVQAGVRYTDSKQFADTIANGGLLYGFVSGSLGAGTANDEATTFSLAPRWQFAPDSMIYARVASGFRPGGVNYFIPGAPPDYNFAFTSDSTVNYEVGLRTQLLDGRLSIDVAAFYIDWTDIQISALFTSTATGQVYGVIANAGEAKSSGLEWNLAYEPIPGLTIQAVGALTEAELSRDAPALGGLAGDRLAYVPDISNTLNIDYAWPAFGDYEAFVGGSWTYVGERYTDFGPANPLQGTHLELPSYDTISLQAGLRSDRYTLEAFVRNLTDEFAITSYGDTGGFNPAVGFTGLANIIQPRTFGVRVAASF
jgi:iron complex outermembrane recepter protein